MKRLCTICARGGSKGVPDKNIRPLAGKPLIVHSIEQAKATGLFTAVAVSSDSPKILEVARAGGADMVILRPAELATDTAAKLPAIRHAVLEAERRLNLVHDILVDLAATSPIRLPEDIIGAVDLVETGPANNVITASPARNSPYYSLVELDDAGVARLSKPPVDALTRRQNAPPCFDMNGSIYVWRREPFLSAPFIFGPATRLFQMPRERSVDIDEEFDFAIAAMLASHLPQKIRIR
ncbi:MAG: acylneuraminate cytidylyltransferase family protein [Rhodospirillaceae bacterium]|nr:acylneuraminate cytidylyltransferase family protein [Rhodospirillaceae bacterium]